MTYATLDISVRKSPTISLFNNMMNNYKARARSQSIIVKVKESRVHYITYQTLTLMELSQCQRKDKLFIWSLKSEKKAVYKIKTTTYDRKMPWSRKSKNNIIYVDLNRYYTTNPGLILIGGLPAIFAT
jgi:hypothetical protein